MSEKAARARWDEYSSADLVNEHVMSGLLLVSVHTARSWRASNRGPRFIRLGSRIRYRIADLRAFIDRNSVSTKDDPIPAPSTLRRAV